MPPRLQKATQEIQRFLATTPQKVYLTSQVAALLHERRAVWKLPLRLSARRFQEFLLEKGFLREVTLRSNQYGQLTRFVAEGASVYEIGLTIRPNSYLSHGTAVSLLGLNDQLPKVVYVNKEQSIKPPGGELTQAGLDRAFSHQQRKSKLVYEYEQWNFTVLSGKNTGNLEVSAIRGPSGESISVTNLERTLIDIVVRPDYAGGIYQVLKAYESAKPEMSVNVLVATLKKLNYIYPYHQSIGFLMERAGYEEARWSRLLSLGMNFDFYLTHGIKEKSLNSRWRVYVPKGF